MTLLVDTMDFIVVHLFVMPSHRQRHGSDLLIVNAGCESMIDVANATYFCPHS